MACSAGSASARDSPGDTARPGAPASCADPRPSRNSRWTRKASSFVVSPPASAAARPPAFLSAFAAWSSAFSQLAGMSAAPSRTSGWVIRSSTCVAW